MCVYIFLYKSSSSDIFKNHIIQQVVQLYYIVNNSRENNISGQKKAVLNGNSHADQKHLHNYICYMSTILFAVNCCQGNDLGSINGTLYCIIYIDIVGQDNYICRLLNIITDLVGQSDCAVQKCDRLGYHLHGCISLYDDATVVGFPRSVLLFCFIQICIYI